MRIIIPVYDTQAQKRYETQKQFIDNYKSWMDEVTFMQLCKDMLKPLNNAESGSFANPAILVSRDKKDPQRYSMKANEENTIKNEWQKACGITEPVETTEIVTEKKMRKRIPYKKKVWRHTL